MEDVQLVLVKKGGVELWVGRDHRSTLAGVHKVPQFLRAAPEPGNASLGEANQVVNKVGDFLHPEVECDGVVLLHGIRQLHEFVFLWVEAGGLYIYINLRSYFLGHVTSCDYLTTTAG